MPRPRMTYARAGVDIDKISIAHRALAKILETTFETRRRKVGRPIFPIGHYAGLIDIGNNRVLSLHTDNVGTKMIIARLMNKYDSVGIDCVAICANDLICTGSEPVAFLDHISLDKPDLSVVGQIAAGIAKGAIEAGMAVVGGETAITPDLISGKVGDIIGMAVGVCSKDELVLGDGIQDRDAIVGVASSGIHSNGLTLARKVLLARHRLTDSLPGLGRRLGEELLEPTRIYVKPVMDVLRRTEVHGLSHITGGAFTKLNRVVSQAGLGARLDNFKLPPALFELIQKESQLSDREMYRTFNMGVGFIVICPEKDTNKTIRIFDKHHQDAFPMGHVEKKQGIWIRGKRID